MPKKAGGEDPAHQLRTAAYVELLVEAMHMRMNSRPRQADRLANLIIALICQHVLENFRLATRQPENLRNASPCFFTEKAAAIETRQPLQACY